jgi:hypothetical protein
MHTLRTFFLVFAAFCISFAAAAQAPVDLKKMAAGHPVKAAVNSNLLEVTWPAGKDRQGKLVLDMKSGEPLIRSIQLQHREVAAALNPAFLMKVGKRDLVSQNGWNIFFDRTPNLPYSTFPVTLRKDSFRVTTSGTHAVIRVAGAAAGPFNGAVEITLFAGSPLLNIAAVMSTAQDSTAILYDAGLTAASAPWEKISWADPEDYVQSAAAVDSMSARPLAVKYRTIIGENPGGSIAVFPAPHQYFYPLDNCFNLAFTWYGRQYKGQLDGYGIGIRQDPAGDRRWVPWFNAPPGTQQRLNFFCLISTERDGKALDAVKPFTHQDTYVSLPGYYTMCSHFHQEHTDDVLNHRPLPDMPGFVKAFRKTGVNIVHLGEFHGPGNPRGPEAKRWTELETLFRECERLSAGNFLMLPGEEPNNFFGGHWMNIFPKPVYWMMSRKPGDPFVEEHPRYGKLYRIGSKEDMLKLLEAENGLAWTAHARTKGSTGFPDKYREEAFYKSPHFMGAAWKAMPADLSQPFLGKRVLDLMDDMANWGLRKTVIAEADLFRIEPEYELYGHLNVNYLQLDRMPSFKEGWQPVLDVMQRGRFFVSTGEVLLPAFNVNGSGAGDTLALGGKGAAKVTASVSWTFPLNYAVIVSGDGKEVYRQQVDLHDTAAFGEKEFSFPVNLQGRTWVRLEVWDMAANGAFTQCVWLK